MHRVGLKDMSSSCLLVLTSALAPAFPGPEYLRPTIHFTRDEVSEFAAWHDIAGAFTHRGVHHIYQGEGWNHAFSTDLVNWRAGPHGPRKEHETYAGMDSFSDPCSGFVTKDDEGVVCAGFRQCGSSKGVNKTNYHDWDVPLELRCALDDNLTAWNDAAPDYLFNVTFYRPVPYDPARPWREADGHYYVLLSFDHCNVTTKKLPCDSGGGMLVAWRSPALRGPKADWQYVGPVFSSNHRSRAPSGQGFVTIDYLGGLRHPAASSGSRIFLNNGRQRRRRAAAPAPRASSCRTGGAWGALVEVAPGMVDWGAFRCATALVAAIGSLGGYGCYGSVAGHRIPRWHGQPRPRWRTRTRTPTGELAGPACVGWTGPPDAAHPSSTGATPRARRSRFHTTSRRAPAARSAGLRAGLRAAWSAHERSWRRCMVPAAGTPAEAARCRRRADQRAARSCSAMARTQQSISTPTVASSTSRSRGAS